MAWTSAHAPTKEGPSFANSSSEARPPPATAAADVKGDDDDGVDVVVEDGAEGEEEEEAVCDGCSESGLPNGYAEEGAGLDLGEGVADEVDGLLPLFEVLMGLWPKLLLFMLFASTLESALSLPLSWPSSSLFDPVSTATDSLQVLTTGRIARTRNSYIVSAAKFF